MRLLGIVILFLTLFLFSHSSNAKQTRWVKDNVYSGEITWIKNAHIELPPGDFTLVYTGQWSSWGIDINSKWLMKTQGNLYDQDISFDRIGSVKYLAYLKVLYQEIFFNNKYDGCYPRSEYTVMELRKKGGFFNCFIVRHVDINKALYAPDDPQATSVHAKQVIKEYNLELPPIILCSTTYFYSPMIYEYVLGLDWCVNPEINGASKSLYTSEESSEYHPQNINKFPDKKKYMEKFIKLAAQRHKAFEKAIKARENHKLDLSKYGVGEAVEVTESLSSSSDLTEELKELYKLYKEGVLTKKEFEKAKKKVLSQ